MSRMRLQAAISLVYLAKVEAFAPDISMSFVRLALVVQVSSWHWLNNVFISYVLTGLLLQCSADILVEGDQDPGGISRKATACI